jgi:Flp pilus assembly protein TadB
VKLSSVPEAPGLAKRLMPWWSVSTTVLLAVVLVVDVTAGRVIETIIIAILLVPSLAFLVLWVIAWKRR